jgi:hypothetical protein
LHTVSKGNKTNNKSEKNASISFNLFTWIEVISEELFGDPVSRISRSPCVGPDSFRTVFAFREDPVFQDLVPGNFGADGCSRYTTE